MRTFWDIKSWEESLPGQRTEFALEFFSWPGGQGPCQTPGQGRRERSTYSPDKQKDLASLGEICFKTNPIVCHYCKAIFYASKARILSHPGLDGQIPTLILYTSGMYMLSLRSYFQLGCFRNIISNNLLYVLDDFEVWPIRGLTRGQSLHCDLLFGPGSSLFILLCSNTITSRL